MKKLKKLFFLFVIGLIPIQIFAWPGIPTPTLHVDGKYLKDPCGNNVLLHGVAITPSPWFNGCASGSCRWDNYDVAGCLNYNNAVMDALTNTSNGWYLNYIRLHIDPYWTNNPGTPVDGESDISQFNFERLKTTVDNIIIPMIAHAKSRGMYVILRPPGVCPNQIAINDAYYNYLVTVWNYLSQHSGLKNADNVMFELANEPVDIRASDGTYGSDNQKYYDALKNYFQSIANMIRNNGANNVIWVPGLGYQSLYRGLASNPITGSNIAYAVHVYPGYWGANAEDPNSFTNAWNTHIQPVANIAPIVITETDWTPDGKGTWGKGTTSGFGTNLKGRIDASGNASWNVLCPEDLITNGDPYAVTTAFNNYWEACAAPCKLWFSQYACCNLPAPSCGCTPTSITPYSQVNDGSWQQTSSVAVNSGVKVKFGPQPTSGGSWSWNGGGTSGTSREQIIYPTSSITATATYTNSCGATSTQTFTVNINSQNVHLTKSNASGFSIDGNNGGADGQQIYLWANDASNVNQTWVEIDRGGGYYSYQKLNTNYCIDGGNGGANGQSVYLWTCDANNQNQQWQKISAGSNFRLQKRNASGYSIDGGNGGANGQILYLWASDANNQNQQWIFSTSSLKSAKGSDDENVTAVPAFGIYPNPSSDGNFAVSFFGLGSGDIKLCIYNLEGKKVYEQNNISVGDNHVISGLKPGAYIVKANCGKYNFTQKLIVE